MKTKLILKLATMFALTFICFASCNKATQTPEQIEKTKNERITNHFKRVEWEGHTYIVYELNSPQYGKFGITHDPDCEYHECTCTEE